jgi:phospholipid/cholesterol/gamma-HCH transport system substrate-binding protein
VTGLKQITAKFIAFAVVSLALFILLLNTMLNGVPGGTRAYSAEFADVSGLRVGDDVRVAGVRVGRVQKISVSDNGARVDFDLVKEQPLLTNTGLAMRYQNLLGQRYLALVQPAARPGELPAGSMIPESRTDRGFDLTSLLNGFRPLFETLKPADVNQLATSLVMVLQGEGPTVQQLLQQTTQLTKYVADRDEVFHEVLNNLTPVLKDVAGQGTELTATVKELRALMTGLAKDRQAIGASIEGVSTLISSTSNLLNEARDPLTQASHEFKSTAALLARNKAQLVAALRAFQVIFGAFGRLSSYENAFNVYPCTLWIQEGGANVNLAGGDGGPWSEACR